MKELNAENTKTFLLENKKGLKRLLQMNREQ
jgi:hypothetical protein